MAAYYNEIDPFAAQWLRNLIAAGLIAPGDVDERSGAPHGRHRLYFVADAGIERLERQHPLLREKEPGWLTGEVSETPWRGETGGTSPTNGFWRNPDWIRCRDGKWRPVEPGTFPLAHGLPPEWDAYAPTETPFVRQLRKR